MNRGPTLKQLNRKLVHSSRVTIEDLARAEITSRQCPHMGDKVEPRRKWIEDNVKFTRWRILGDGFRGRMYG